MDDHGHNNRWTIPLSTTTTTTTSTCAVNGHGLGDTEKVCLPCYSNGGFGIIDSTLLDSLVECGSLQYLLVPIVSVHNEIVGRPCMVGILAY
eukprot:scaffold204301_cov55-Attheya_sp.AAC.1